MRALLVLAVLAVLAPALARVVNPAVLRERSRGPRLPVAQADSYSPEFSGAAMQDRGYRSMQRVQAMGYPRFVQGYPQPQAQPIQQGPNFFAAASQMPPAPVVAPADVDDSDMRFRGVYAPQPGFPVQQPYAQFQQAPYAPQYQQPMGFAPAAAPEFLDMASTVTPAASNPVTEAIANAYSSDRFQEGRASYAFPENAVNPLPNNSPAGPFRFREVYAPAPAAAPVAAGSYPNMNMAHTPSYGAFPVQRVETAGAIPPPPSMPNLPPPPVGIF